MRTTLALLTVSMIGVAWAGPDPPAVRAATDKAVAYLKLHQNAEGGFDPPRMGKPGITALVVTALLRSGLPADDPAVAKGLAFLEKHIKPDGGIYDQGLANYSTSVCVLAFKEANANGKYDSVLAKAVKFLKALQAGDESADQVDARYGGLTYDKASARSSPDLSNTAFFIEALTAAGVGKDDPAVKRAMTFINRCQNLPGETNDQPFAAKTAAADKGGFVYKPTDAAEAKSPRRTPEGGLRSEGAMTYSGLKSFLYAGVSKDDPRVAGAVKWIGRNYTLEENPGQKLAGLFYYYQTFAKALHALGQDEFTDGQGTKHDWKADLFAALQKRQRADGSWANTDRAFMETNAELSTAFALLALSYCK